MKNFGGEFNANELPSGIYFYKLQANEFAQIKKIILLK
ncbi:MAG: T9SS type A sorting domain-containing protein [Ignavibacteria bacterium]|nr:MAG: T9SS type A sorting domain-containing protein [Ignavibacteria bacterium]